MREAAIRLPSDSGHYKDAILNQMAETDNVAQFISFGPGLSPRVRFARLRGEPPQTSESVARAVELLFRAVGDGTVNVRSFDPDQPRGNEFLYALADSMRVVEEVRRLAAKGLHTIVNETIPVDDGGVSGVVYGGIVEFAPDDTPRCVDKPGTVALGREIACRILETVYGFPPELDYPNGLRVEFSIHPQRRGVRHRHTIVWESEQVQPIRLVPQLIWPNRFSRIVGDKAFGLLVADAVGLAVPATTVVGRRIAPFRFGSSTGTAEYWMRTCPVEPVPGRYATTRSWVDPFNLLSREDRTGEAIASVLAQEGVSPNFSGAALSTNGRVVIEGVEGPGDAFMQGSVGPQRLPKPVLDSVRETHASAVRALGPVRIEWVYDGQTTWVVQLHRGASETNGSIIFPGDAIREHRFVVEEGLEALRQLVTRVSETQEGVVLVGDVGLTSHFGDILRKAKVPSRLEKQ